MRAYFHCRRESFFLCLAIIVAFAPLICPVTGEDARIVQQPVDGTLTKVQEEIRSKLIDRRNQPMPPFTREKYVWDGQPRGVHEALKAKKNGTFIDIGANDGFYLSMSLGFEVEHGWRGLLVEPVPEMFQKLNQSRRSSLYLHACVSRKQDYLYKVDLSKLKEMKEDANETGMAQMDKATILDPANVVSLDGQEKANLVQCYPLYDIMKAAGLTKVDILMLHVPGSDIDVLRMIPWDLVDIELIQTEINYMESFRPHHELGKLEQTMKFLDPHGYYLYHKFHRNYYVFIKKSLVADQ